MKKFNSALVAGIVAALSMLLSSGANAASYSVSTNSISNFGISFTNSPTYSGFTFNGNAAAANGASLFNVGAMDAAASCVNCTSSNSFTAHGASASSYAYGDTYIPNANVWSGVGAAQAIGEVYLNAPSIGGPAFAYGINTMSASIYVPTSTVMTFNFFATPYLEATLSPGGLWAAANMAMTVTLYKTGVAGPIFSWAPNGAGGGISGGTENVDTFSLNTSLAQLTNGTSPYNPGTGQFQAMASLASGTYSLNISMSNTAQAQAVPVPAAIWLLGSGLIGLAGVARRRRNSSSI